MHQQAVPTALPTSTHRGCCRGWLPCPIQQLTYAEEAPSRHRQAAKSAAHREVARFVALLVEGASADATCGMQEEAEAAVSAPLNREAEEAVSASANAAAESGLNNMDGCAMIY